MQTYVINSYNFDELSDYSKENARNWWREAGVHDKWFDCTFDTWKDALAMLGVDVENIYFSGFSSQGDGACFTGRYSYAKGWRVALAAEFGGGLLDTLTAAGEQLQALQARYFYGISAGIVHHGRYYHSNSVSVNCEYDNPNKPAWDDTGADDEVTSIMRGLMDDIYTALENEYDYLMSAGQIDDAIRANDYEFNNDGGIF